MNIGTDTNAQFAAGIVGNDRWLAPTATGMPALIAELRLAPALVGDHVADGSGIGPAAHHYLGWVHENEKVRNANTRLSALRRWLADSRLVCSKTICTVR